MPLHLERCFSGNICILRCKGQIVLGEGMRALETQLEAASRESCRLVLDMGEVDRLDSIGLGLLVRCMSNLRKRGGDLRLASAPRFLVDLLRTTRLITLLHNYPSEADAVQSFVSQTAGQTRQRRRVLVIDRSPDLTAFVRAVLTQHGFEVNSASLIREARTLLQFQAVDFILLGPGTPQTAPASPLETLRKIAPGAETLELGPDFSTFDAQRAAEVLLNLFQARNAAV